MLVVYFCELEMRCQLIYFVDVSTEIVFRLEFVSSICCHRKSTRRRRYGKFRWLCTMLSDVELTNAHTEDALTVQFQFLKKIFSSTKKFCLYWAVSMLKANNFPPIFHRTSGFPVKTLHCTIASLTQLWLCTFVKSISFDERLKLIFLFGNNYIQQRTRGSKRKLQGRTTLKWATAEQQIEF